MKLRLDYNNMMKEFVGVEGIAPSEIEALRAEIEAAKTAMRDKRERGLMDWRNLPYNQKEIVRDIKNYVNEVKDRFDAFVLLGIGGSALGPAAIQRAINHPFYNELPRARRGGYPKFYICDNIDPEALPYLFDVVDITKTLFNVVSKSGSTSETMSQYMIIKHALENRLGKKNASEHIVATTDAEKGNLVKLARQDGNKTFFIPSGVGGRFSELCPVGLLPAAMCGVDIESLLDGAAYMDELCQNENIYANPAYMYAILNYIALRKNKNVCVMAPYADSLKYVAAWYAQLWAESLGKKYDNDGNIVNAGPTPVGALGATDQHSQLQLYVEGPFDKIITFIGVDEYGKTTPIPNILPDMPSVGFLGGATQNRLIQTEQFSTEYALTAAGRMNMTITLPRANEFALGQLLYMLEVATGFAGELMNINAFDQPGVEEGKNATYALFGRPGYEEKRKELEQAPKKKDAYLI